jgi:radical SAM protein with 4Fe4S-binding SPASM domain
MMSLMDEMSAKALRLGIPLSVHVDLTYRCNERCVHCYLDHDDRGEMSTAELKDLLDQLAEAGVFFLTFSGGEIFLRRDLFELLRHARLRTFAVKLKTNGLLIGGREAAQIQSLGATEVQISIYSHRAEVHDRITKVAGSLARSVGAIRLLRAHGVRVIIANVLMIDNAADYAGVRALAADLGVEATIDPTVTPKLDGDRSILSLNVAPSALARVFHDPCLVGDPAGAEPTPGSWCEPREPSEADLDELPCSAGHTACYVSPYGDVYPCVQFPLPSGNVRQARFQDIWRDSPQLREVRSIRARDLPSCSSCRHLAGCTRCPGLAYMEGNMRGPSTQDCEKSLARTGVRSAHLLSRPTVHLPLIQIQR